jgi:hypothetical protein
LRLDFNNPFQGRKWLNLLECEDIYKLKFKPNLDYEKHKLGFTFTSNKFGFRGTENFLSDDLILGTSFAMGMSVNNGENWYENLAIPQPFNLAIPSGIISQNCYYKQFYKGGNKTLIYIYHPNIWQFTRDQIYAIQSQINLFDLKSWKTDILSVLKLLPKYFMKRLFIFKKIRFNNKYYRLIPNYSFFKVSKLNFSSAKRHMQEFEEVASCFQRVVVIRVPVKEQYGFGLNSPLSINYLYWWNYFKSNSNSNIEFYDVSDKFDLSYYHEFDTHWNLLGNKHFTKLFCEIFNKK